MPIIGGKRYPYPKKKNKMKNGPSDSDMEEVFRNPNKAYENKRALSSTTKRQLQNLKTNLRIGSTGRQMQKDSARASASKYGRRIGMLQLKGGLSIEEIAKKSQRDLAKLRR